MQRPEALVVFLRLPILGKVKTRIATSTGDEMALRIYQHLMACALQSAAETNIPVFLFYEGGIPSLSDRDKRFTYVEQTVGPLDQKISHAISFVLGTYSKVIVIGSDCPELSSTTLKESFKQLDTSDIVIGPAVDGGFYLLGCKKLNPEILQDIQWSTSSVLQKLLSNVRNAGLSFHLLDELADIDTEADWLTYIKREEP